MGHGLLYGVTGTELRFLDDELRLILRHRLRNSIAAVAIHYADLFGRHVLGALQHVLHHGFACQRMQDFGLVGIHARALAGREDDDVQWTHSGAVPEEARIINNPLAGDFAI